MKKISCVSLLVGAMFWSVSVQAQLPANPWDASSSGVAHIKRVAEAPLIESVKYAPVNADKEAPVYQPAIDSTGKSKALSANSQTQAVSQDVKTYSSQAGTTKTANTQTQAASTKGQSWIGSGNYGKLNYTGEATTYGTAYGQEMIAPEVNSGNIKVMIQHLRNLGYKIPDSYDDKMQNFLQDYAKDLDQAYRGVGRQNNPLDTMFSGFLDVFEKGSGLDVENLLFNSMNLITKQ